MWKASVKLKSEKNDEPFCAWDTGCLDDGSYNSSFWIPVASKKELVYRKKKWWISKKKKKKKELVQVYVTMWGVISQRSARSFLFFSDILLMKNKLFYK